LGNLPIVQDRLRGGFTQLKLGAHFLQARSKRFDFLFLLRGSGDELG
jgi:hypothetical protein